jgi:hypothetical protein
MSEYLWTGLGAIAVALFWYFKWREMTAAERAALLEDLVSAAKQKFAPGQNEKKRQYVFAQLKKNFPWLPTETIDAMLEAEYLRQKAAGLMDVKPQDPPAASRWN